VVGKGEIPAVEEELAPQGIVPGALGQCALALVQIGDDNLVAFLQPLHRPGVAPIQALIALPREKKNWAVVSTYLRVIELSISLSAWYALGTHEWLTEHATAYMATPSVVPGNV
jgi:hypothetical protein